MRNGRIWSHQARWSYDNVTCSEWVEGSSWDIKLRRCSAGAISRFLTKVKSSSQTCLPQCFSCIHKLIYTCKHAMKTRRFYHWRTVLISPKIAIKWQCAKLWGPTVSNNSMCYWSEVQMICIWSRWCHCHTIISCFIKIQNGSVFLVPA